LKNALLLFMQKTTQIRPLQQRFLNKIYFTHEEKVTSPIQQRFLNKIYFTHEEKVNSFAANSATGCLHNQLHSQLCLMELLRELSSASDHYSGRTSELQHTGSRAA